MVKDLQAMETHGLWWPNIHLGWPDLFREQSYFLVKVLLGWRGGVSTTAKKWHLSYGDLSSQPELGPE